MKRTRLSGARLVVPAIPLAERSGKSFPVYSPLLYRL